MLPLFSKRITKIRSSAQNLADETWPIYMINGDSSGVLFIILTIESELMNQRRLN